MPHEEMTEQQVANYLHLDRREVHKLASRGVLPGRRVGSAYRFRKGQVDHWVELQMHELPAQRLAMIEKGVSEHHGFEHEAPLIVPMIPAGGLAAPLLGRTRDGAIRALADLADKAELLYDRDKLVMEIRQREELCTTAILPGVALPHPRHPLPNDIASSFVVAGVAPAGIPFGSLDGSLTRVFFLICCKDDRTHLHVLARLGQMLQEPGAVEDFIHAADADELGRVLRRHEQAILK